MRIPEEQRLAEKQKKIYKQLTKQEKRLLDYLKKHRSINPIMSWQTLGIYRLSDVVFKLRNRGFNIETERKTVMNKWQEKTSFATYILERAS
tara:strand:- start:918 stop:1193 length:276 start_codon:yes stop_codon:yes gene_type:complete